MSTNATLAAPVRGSKRTKTTPASAGLPDPRPLTEYDATYGEIAGHSRITITLRQPCVVRNPQWSFVDSVSGASITAASVTPIDNKTIFFDFVGLISDGVNFVDVPYQDMQVQNFQGGFVRPGGQWFRSPK